MPCWVLCLFIGCSFAGTKRDGDRGGRRGVVGGRRGIGRGRGEVKKENDNWKLVGLFRRE